MPGPMELVIILGMLSPVFGIGLPIGLPPGENDPRLLNMAPESCVYATIWAATAQADPDSTNHVERLLAEPELRDVVQHLVDVVRKSTRRVALEQDNRQLGVVADIVPRLATVLFTRPAAVYVESIRSDPDRFDAKAALIVNLGDERMAVERAITRLRRQVVREAELVEIDGKPFAMLRPSQDTPHVTWGIHGDYFILGLGERAVESALARAKTDPPRWLIEVEQRFAIDRRATLTYANVTKLIEAVGGAQGETTRRLMSALGLDGLDTYISATGLDATERVSHSVLAFAGEPRGLFGLIDNEGLAAADLEAIPADALVALAVRVDGRRVIDLVRDVTAQVDERAELAFEEVLQAAEDELGFHVVDDLLASLGDVWRVYTSRGGGGLVMGWTLSVPVRDAAKLARVEKELLTFLKTQLGTDTTIKSRQVKEAHIHSISSRDFGPLMPSWSIHQGRLVFGLFPQAVRADLQHGDRQGLGQRPEVAALLEQDARPAMLTYWDTKDVFEAAYPLFIVTVEGLAGQLNQGGIDIDVGLLPPREVISQHLLPGTSTIRMTDRGIVMESRQTTPAGNLGASLPLVLAAAVPAITSAREASERTQAVNHMKQILLAMLNHESAMQALPAAYNTDANGEPLLSWRVHILPYLDHGDLYEQFHLDEPWDSDHNRRLIMQMPDVYKSPGSLSDPGKTNFLAVSGESHFMIPPDKREFGKHFPAGVRFREITDGTSNTIAVVEVSDALATIWTKPGDFVPDADNPVNGLAGLRENVFMVGFCDGSVQVMSVDIDPTTLRAMFTRAGGEVIER